MELLKYLLMVCKALDRRVQFNVKSRQWRPWVLADAQPYFLHSFTHLPYFVLLHS